MKCSFAEKGPQVLVDKLTKSQQCAKNEDNLTLGRATKIADVRESKLRHKRDKDKLGQIQDVATNLIMKLDAMTHKVKLREVYLFNLRKKHKCGNSWESAEKAEPGAAGAWRRAERGREETGTRRSKRRSDQRPARLLVNFHMDLNAVTHVWERLLQISSGVIHVSGS